MRNRGFLSGMIAGLVLAVIIGIAGLGFLLFFNLGHLGEAAEVIYKVKTNSIQSLSATKMVDGAMEGIVGALDDPYSTYLDPQEYTDLEEHLSGSYGGIGLLITEDESNRLMVVSPFKGTPAYRVGIRSGDVIVQIGDQDATNLSLGEAAGLMKGDPGTAVTLAVLPKGGAELKEYNIVREEIQIPSVEGSILEDNPRIAYINLTMFSQQTGSELRKAFKDVDIASCDGVILDLRDNPGGALDAAIEVAGYFIPQGPAVHILYNTGETTLQTEDRYIRKPLVVLVNDGSASASEIVAGAIQDSGSGELVGTTTFGKGLVQSVFPMSSGSALKLTTAKYLTPDGHDINKKGIKPDVEVELPPDMNRQELLYSPDLDKDVQLQKAVEVLTQKIK